VWNEAKKRSEAVSVYNIENWMPGGTKWAGNIRYKAVRSQKTFGLKAQATLLAAVPGKKRKMVQNLDEDMIDDLAADAKANPVVHETLETLPDQPAKKKGGKVDIATLQDQVDGATDDTVAPDDFPDDP
jgi:hypothetical protein